MGMLAGTRTGLVDVASGAVVAYAGRDVSAMDGDWVVLDGREVHDRAGAAPAALVMPPDGDRVLCVAGRPDGTAWAGTAGAHIFRAGRSVSRVESFDSVDGRNDWYTPWGGPPDVRSMAVSSDGTALANVHVGGIVRSTDDGASWHSTIDIHADVHQVLAVPGGRALAACAVGLATSDDDGATWSVHDDGLHATYARSVALAGDTVLLGVSAGPGGGGAAVYRRPLGEEVPFERCRFGLPDDLGGNIDTAWLVGAPDGTAAFVTAAGDVFDSDDEGVTWERAAAGLAGVRALDLG